MCLQEVTPTTVPLWREALGPHVMWSLEVPGRPREVAEHEGPRPLGVLVAGPEPLVRVRMPGVPWPERALHVRIGAIDVVNLHSPISPSRHLAKVRFHEALLAHLRAATGPTLVAGDLNTPRRELPDGSLLTFAHNSDGSLRPARGERWDAAEQALLRALGWTDAFRALHGLARKEVSWTYPSGGGYRLDHVILSPGLEPVAAEYLHPLRESGLSDHSGLLVEVRETT